MEVSLIAVIHSWKKVACNSLPMLYSTTKYFYISITDQLLERGYYANLKQLTEEMYEDSGNTRVTLLAISMGGPVSHYFLTRVVN